MGTLGNYNLNIKYRPGKEMVTADALSHLFVRSTTGKDRLDSNWFMSYNYDLDLDMLPGTSLKTCDKVILEK